MSQRIFKNDLVAINKNKVILTLKNQHMSKYNDYLNKLVVAKRKDEIGVAEWRCIHSWEMIVVSIKMQRLWIKMLLKQ